MTGALALYCILCLGSVNSMRPTLQETLTDVVPGATENDKNFWAIHHLLVFGKEAPFMNPDTDGKAMVQRSAETLARLMVELHPVELCRKQLASASTVDEVAEVVLSCLGDGGLNSGSFRVQMGKGIVPVEPIFGACSKSNYKLGCSIWTSLHAMAERADQLGMSRILVESAFAIIVGGATQCGSCTRHFVMLNSGTGIIDALLSDRHDGSCFGRQCGEANAHVTSLVECAADAGCEDPQLKKELQHMTAWKAYLSSWASEHRASDVFVGLHNLVTESINDKWLQKSGYFCTRDDRSIDYSSEDILAAFPPRCP